MSSTPNLWTGYFRRSLQNKIQLHIHFSLGRTYCTKPQKLHDLHVKENRKTNLHSLQIDLERQQSNASFHQLTIQPNVCGAQKMKLWGVFIANPSGHVLIREKFLSRDHYGANRSPWFWPVMRIVPSSEACNGGWYLLTASGCRKSYSLCFCLVDCVYLQHHLYYVVSKSLSRRQAKSRTNVFSIDTVWSSSTDKRDPSLVSILASPGRDRTQCLCTEGCC